MEKELKITQIKSAIDCEKSHKETIRSLGIKKLHQTVYHKNTPQIRGMIQKVNYLLKVEEVER